MEPTWFTHPDGRRLLVLPVGSDLDDGPPYGYDVAAVPMTPAYAGQLLGLARRALEMRAALDGAHELCSIECYDTSVDYYNADWEREFLPVPDDTMMPDWQREDGESRTERDRLVLDVRLGRVDFSWSACTKYGEQRIETAALSYDDLVRYLRGEDPWADGGVMFDGPSGWEEG